MNLFLHFCTKLISFISFHLGRRLSRALFSVLGILWFDIFRIRRKDVLAHLAIAFPEMSMPDKVKLGRKSLMLMTANLSDLFSIPYIDKKWAQNNVIVTGEEHVREALNLGKGVLLLGMHVGNGDLTANLIVLRGMPLHLITKFFKNKQINDTWFAVRGAKGVNYIEPHGEKTPFQILKALKSNQLVVFVNDQFMGKPFGIETNFFGHPTGSAQGLALFHLKTKSPIVPVYCYEGDDRKFHYVFEPVLSTASMITDDKTATILRLTQYFCDVTEGIIRKHPSHWMWLHRRWKNFND